MGLGGQYHAPAALPPGKKTGTYFIGGWVGLSTGLDWCGKSRPAPGFDHRTVQPVVGLYADALSRPTMTSFVTILIWRSLLIFSRNLYLYLTFVTLLCNPVSKFPNWCLEMLSTTERNNRLCAFAEIYLQ